MTTYEVKVAVYDLSRGMARALSQSILGQQIEGIWHTGIVVYNKEYYFGGGIQVVPWGQFASMNNLPPTEVRSLGHTNKNQAELETYLRSINHLYTQMTYDLINNNCNNFSDTVSRFLLGTGIPSYIIDLPRTVFSTPGGAMLRPMIESMQNNVRQQQGYGLDPFGGGSSATSAPSAQPGFETALSESVTSLVMNMAEHSAVEQQATTVKKAELDEKALVSADAGSAKVLVKKLLNLADPATRTPGSALSEAEKIQLQNIVDRLTSTTTADGKKDKAFTVEDYVLLERILANHPEAHMSALFIIRIMFLHDQMTDFKEINLIREIIGRLLASKDTVGFESIPAHVMALCAISNLLSHEAGLALLYNTNAGTSDDNISTELANNIVDVVLSGLNHGRAEVRQMSSTLAYNLVLAYTKDDQLSGAWKPESSATETELNGQAMQLLCSSLESLTNEQVMSAFIWYYYYATLLCILYYYICLLPFIGHSSSQKTFSNRMPHYACFWNCSKWFSERLRYG
jgi:hypothetical protein